MLLYMCSCVSSTGYKSDMYVRGDFRVVPDIDIILVDLSNEEGKVATYVLRFTVPFMAIAAILYVVDTIIRKLQWADIESLFKRRKKSEEATK